MSYDKAVNSTARTRGAVGKMPIAVRYLLNQDLDPRTNTVLDFGAGPEAIHSKLLQEKGFRVSAWEVGDNFNPEIHDINALDDQYDIVLASNVLNVQPSYPYLHWVLATLRGAVDPDFGRLVVNYPRSPRKLPLLDGDVLETTLGQYFSIVERPKNFSRMLYVCRGPNVGWRTM